jgi:uncharacterized glyoxalase superfamily protein PhnB
MHVQQTVPLLFVTDIVRSCAFYCDGLGFEISNRASAPGGVLAWCWLSHGGASLMLQQAEADDPPTEVRGKGVVFYFLCDNADAMYQSVTQRGVSATEPAVAFYGMKQTYVTDPDGYELCFESPVDSVC